MSARDELLWIIDGISAPDGDMSELMAFRDKWHPELPDGAIELAPGTHLAQRSVRTERTTDSDVWEIIRADGSVWVGDYDYSWREHGQPIPEPTPEITVGCIVQTPGMRTAVVLCIDNNMAFIRYGGGGDEGYNPLFVDSLAYVAASWDEVPS